MAAAPRVLIVEDDLLIAEYFKIIVEQLGYEVCGLAHSADEAVALARREAPAVIFMDVRLAGERDGVEAGQEIHAIRPVPIIYVTASREPQTTRRIKDNHAPEVLTKPVVLQHIEAALAKYCPLPNWVKAGGDCAGCTRRYTCTGEAAPGDPQHSYANIKRCGFQETYLRENWQP